MRERGRERERERERERKRKREGERESERERERREGRTGRSAPRFTILEIYTLQYHLGVSPRRWHIYLTLALPGPHVAVLHRQSRNACGRRAGSAAVTRDADLAVDT